METTIFVAARTAFAGAARNPSAATNLYLGYRGRPRHTYHSGRIGREVSVGREIERKYLVVSEKWPKDEHATRMRQGYLSAGPPVSVRIRIEADRAWLNIKEPTLGISRAEFEYEIPPADAEELIGLCGGGIVSKTRHRVEHAGHTWEIDVFEGENAGLVLAEVELDSEDEAVELPDWAGADVSTDPRYRNTYLSRHPHRTWGEGTR
jgi:adenylate cyclase